MEPVQKGHFHPLTLLTQDIYRIFKEIGFTVADGPEIETEFYNFDALNVPKDHPARDMQDTFWMKDLDAKGNRQLPRTHTSSVQIRYMEANKPPIRIIAPGKSFRNEATDSTHEAQFWMVECLYVDKDASLAMLKGVLTLLFSKLFAEGTQIRFRPSFFPFTEPSVEVDASCWKCGGKGCTVCKRSGWIELGGAGMVNPKVFEAVNIDANEWKGFAFGFGLERLAMLKYGVTDVRSFNSGDLRLTNQF